MNKRWMEKIKRTARKELSEEERLLEMLDEVAAYYADIRSQKRQMDSMGSNSGEDLDPNSESQ